MMHSNSKERGMIFNAEMVRAILSGLKTQTRRIMAIQPENSKLGLRRVIESKNVRYNGKYFWSQSDAVGLKARSKVFACPYGKVGDRIWVRETWQGPLVDFELSDDLRRNPEKYEKPENCFYSADGVPAPEFYDADDNLRRCWRPSIYMPRWASRILLEITNVRVERLNDISEEDAQAEGVSLSTHTITPPEAVYRVGFSELWRSIYGDEGWKKNPWVWVIEFKRVQEQSND